VGIKKSPGQQRFFVNLAEDEKVRCCAQGADGEKRAPDGVLPRTCGHSPSAVEGVLYSPGACAQPGNPHPPRLGDGP